MFFVLFFHTSLQMYCQYCRYTVCQCTLCI